MKTILMVEDIELNRDLLVQILDDDFEVITAEDGAAGIATCQIAVAVAERRKSASGYQRLFRPSPDHVRFCALSRRSTPLAE